jgi:hypothetical protein
MGHRISFALEAAQGRDMDAGGTTAPQQKKPPHMGAASIQGSGIPGLIQPQAVWMLLTATLPLRRSSAVSKVTF